MIFIALGTFTLAAATWIVVKIRSSRDIDVFQFGLNFVVKSRFVTILRSLGIADRLRPGSTSKIVTINNFEFTTATPLLVRLIFDHVWNFEVRESDVLVATYPKAGTTWAQEIVWLICNNADTNQALETHLRRRSPFLEGIDVSGTLGLLTLEKWPNGTQRMMKTHQPFELLPHQASEGKRGKIVYVARNPKDLCVSYYHFHHMAIALPRPGPWEKFLSTFMEGNVACGDWFNHNLKYWEEHKKNPEQIHFVTYENLKADLFKEIKLLAAFLEKELSDEQIRLIEKRCTFEKMSKNKSVNKQTENGVALDFSKAKFMRKGDVGDWKNYFTFNQSKAFDELFEERMKGTGLKMCFEL